MSQNTTSSSNSKYVVIGIMAGAILLLLVGIGVWRAASSSSTSGSPGKVGPKLAVNQERVDFGQQPFEKKVRAEFQVKNVGDLPLMLDASRPIKALEGC